MPAERQRDCLLEAQPSAHGLRLLPPLLAVGRAGGGEELLFELCRDIRVGDQAVGGSGAEQSRAVLGIAAAARDRREPRQAFRDGQGNEVLPAQLKLFMKRLACALEIAVEERLEAGVPAYVSQRGWISGLTGKGGRLVK